MKESKKFIYSEQMGRHLLRKGISLGTFMRLNRHTPVKF